MVTGLTRDIDVKITISFFSTILFDAMYLGVLHLSMSVKISGSYYISPRRLMTFFVNDTHNF